MMINEYRNVEEMRPFELMKLIRDGVIELPESGKEYTPAEIQALPEKQRGLLTAKPLGGEQIQTLLNTAIGLHARAMEELRESRWWIPVFAAILSSIGAIVGVILSAALHLAK